MNKTTDNISNVVELQVAKPEKKCLLCNKKTQKQYAPFCSKRCADLDLGKWLGDGYRIPTQENREFDEED